MKQQQVPTCLNYAMGHFILTFISPDPLKDAVESTPIPMCLRNIVQLIQSEELGYQRANASDSLGDVEPSLETGPCLEYLLHTRVLEELVEFAKVDVSRLLSFIVMVMLILVIVIRHLMA